MRFKVDTITAMTKRLHLRVEEQAHKAQSSDPLTVQQARERIRFYDGFALGLQVALTILSELGEARKFVHAAVMAAGLPVEHADSVVATLFDGKAGATGADALELIAEGAEAARQAWTEKDAAAAAGDQAPGSGTTFYREELERLLPPLSSPFHARRNVAFYIELNGERVEVGTDIPLQASYDTVD